MNTCACGCGSPTSGVWVHGGHAQRVCHFLPTGAKGVIPFERVRPLLAFLWEHGSESRYGRDITLARTLGVSYSRVWVWRNRPPRGVPYTTARRIVRAVKDIEDGLRREAYREATRDAQRAYRGYRKAVTA